ncbi:MAG: type II secretion system protein [Planctomycetota bacterium]|jgi:prepilin-type N-terminal cleavage/methylation domain-containing protein
MQPLVHRSQQSDPTRAGFTLVELTIVMVIMTVAVGMLSSTITSSSRIGPLMREEALAAEAARFQLESLLAGGFDEALATYNDLAADDPDGASSAPGMHFDVPGLEVRTFDEDGHVGRFDFPTVDGHLREDSARDDLGMPRDLNGDGEIDGQPHDGDHTVLPFAVVVEWQGVNGPRTLRLYCTVVAP